MICLLALLLTHAISHWYLLFWRRIRWNELECQQTSKKTTLAFLVAFLVVFSYNEVSLRKREIHMGPEWQYSGPRGPWWNSDRDWSIASFKFFTCDILAGDVVTQCTHDFRMYPASLWRTLDRRRTSIVAQDFRNNGMKMNKHLWRTRSKIVELA